MSEIQPCYFQDIVILRVGLYWHSTYMTDRRTTETAVAELESSTPPVKKAAIELDPETAPSTSHYCSLRYPA